MSEEQSIEVTPTGLSRADDGSIKISWSDETESTWTVGQLRKACPCATCREKRRSEADAPKRPMELPILSAAEAKPLEIESMRPVGTYAYNISFSDGHSSGIYTFAILRSNPS